MLIRQHNPLVADPTRVVARPFIPLDSARVLHIVGRLMALPEAEVERTLHDLWSRYAHRHRDFDAIIERHAQLVEARTPLPQSLGGVHRKLLGATFTHEYSIEAAALFNPSIVPHPDQGGVADGELRVLLSFRSTGEGHLSSMTFREGVIRSDGTLLYRDASRWATLPALTTQGFHFPEEVPLAERVIFPMTADERVGIEDARWVHFVDEEGAATWYALYTAFDGLNIRPKMMETTDFRHFDLHSLHGAAVANKGFALFPRRVSGRYVMLGRQDNEQNFIMLSDDLECWEDVALLRGPQGVRELVQIGNNGSPIETPEGWLLLTHGVGPMREYTLSAELLALDDPTRVIAYLPGSLIAPTESEREGYVPNVIYTCGAILHSGWLVIPYAHSDAACDVARVRLDELLGAMTRVTA